MFNEQINEIKAGFLEASIFQDENLDGMAIYQFDIDTLAKIDMLVLEFYNSLTVDMIGIINDNEVTDFSEVGQWLCFELMGHGAGFFDCQNDVISSISDSIMQTMRKKWAFESVYNKNDNLFIDFRV